MNALLPAQPVASWESLTFQVVADTDRLRRLAPSWQDLLEHSAAPNLMRSPDWLLTWWNIYGRGRQLCVGTWHDGDRLVGLAPLCRRTYWYRPGIPFRRLEFLGSDVDENDGVCSEYLSLIARENYESRVGEAFVGALARRAFGDWDECVFSAMDQDQDVTSLLRGALQRLNATLETTPAGVAPFVRLPRAWPDYLSGLSKKKRQSLTYALRDFHAWAGPDWKLQSARTEEDVREGLRVLVALHGERWRAAGEAGAFGSPRFHRFHEDFAQQALRNRQLMLLWITVRDVPVAALYGFVAHGQAQFYQCGRSLAAPAKVRLGIVIVILAMQEAIAQRLSEFDFLGGDAQYKSLFTSDERPLCQIRVARRGLPEFSRTLARKTWHLVRALRRGGAALFAQLPWATPTSKQVNHLP